MALKIYKHWGDYPIANWRWKNFTPQEMASKREGELAIDEPSMDKLQALRDLLSVPLHITSAYRSKAHNTAVGGEDNSFHMKAMAFDIQMKNHSPHAFEAAARQVGFTGFGYYQKQGFMHIDTGPKRSWGTPWPKGAK